MKKKSRNKTVLGIIVLAGLVLFWQGLQPECASGDTYKGCEANSAVRFTCEEGKWVKEIIEDCSGGVCFEGVCVLAECSGEEVKYSCLSSWKSLTQTCENGLFKNRMKFCGQLEYCKEGSGCVASPTTCDNGVCDEGEDVINCPRDCGALSSWDLYYADIPDDIKAEYLGCVAEFDCDNPIIAEAIKDMESRFSPKNPREWIESCSQYIYGIMNYNFAGGESQCHTKASNLLYDVFYTPANSFSGNCVDASTVYIAMARFKGIPSYHAGICLTNLRNWRCSTYAFIQPFTGVPQPLGRIDGELKGNVLGHAIAMSYNPLQKKFSPIDPTMSGIGLSKECFGYSPVLETGIDSQVCYISQWQDIDWCTAF